MGYVCAMECFSAVKKNETTAFTYKWTELETVILNEVTQAYK